MRNQIWKSSVSVMLLFVAAFSNSNRLAAEDSPTVVSNIKVLSDKVEDLSSIEAWKKSVIKDGMTDEQKVLAAWLTTVRHRHHDAGAPLEYLSQEKTVNDAIKQFNVYGYGAGPTGLLTLARNMGYEARGWTLWRWGGGVEVNYANEWHFIDPGMICYFKHPDGKIASVEEISNTVQKWFKENPGYYNPVADKEPDMKKMRKEKKLADLPQLIQSCPTYDKNGSFMFNYFGWYSTLLLFSGVVNNGTKTPFMYEEPYTEGYRVNIQLRRGEKLVRNWGNTGLHVNMNGGSAPEILNTKLLYYSPQIGDLSNGRIGNGTLEYNVPVAAIEQHAISSENILSSAQGAETPFIHAKDPAKPAVFVLRRPCSYVYLKGTLTFDAKVENGGDIAIELSDTNGTKWKEISKITASGAQSIDLQPYIIRKYDYRLKFIIKGAGTGISSLKIANDIQHSQRALPALGVGDNVITFNAGKQEGTITVEPAPLKHKEFQPIGEDFQVQEANGTVTVPVETPHDMTCLRFGCNYRASGDNEGYDLQVSFDEGKSFKTIDRAKGPVKHNAKWISATDIPPGTRKALVRFLADSKGSLILFRYRVDADYREPSGGFAPVKITYEWDENGEAKKDFHLAAKADETYIIKCNAKPTLKSITLELAE
jgi:hypothetical protein